ncbi:MAG: hypothetical protein V4857_25205 [Pseudomonadota bacterium]
MKVRYPFEKKSYAMRRMAHAIERAISAKSPEQQERAARWAAAWGSHCGISAKPVKQEQTYDIELATLELNPEVQFEAPPAAEPPPAPEADDGPIAALLALPEQILNFIEPDSPAPA